MVIAWRAKSKKTPVIMGSLAGMTEVYNQKGERLCRSQLQLTQPLNGVDHNDQHVRIVQKTLKWWKKCSFTSSSVPQSTDIYTGDKLEPNHLTFVVHSLGTLSKNTCNSAVIHLVVVLGLGPIWVGTNTNSADQKAAPH